MWRLAIEWRFFLTHLSAISEGEKNLKPHVVMLDVLLWVKKLFTSTEDIISDHFIEDRCW